MEQSQPRPIASHSDPVSPAVAETATPSTPTFSLASFSAGSLSAIVTLSYSVSYGALIFSGPVLQPYVPVGLRAALMAAWIVALVVALGSSFKFAIAGPDSNATAILAVMSGAIVETVGSAKPVEAAATVLVMLTVSAVLTGALVALLGLIGGGRLIRFLPYSVLGGFLAGTGYLVVSGAFKVLTGQALVWNQLRALHPVHPLAWSVTALVAISLLVLPKYVKHYLLMPTVIVGGAILTGASATGAPAAGLGPGALPKKSLNFAAASGTQGCFRSSAGL